MDKLYYSSDSYILGSLQAKAFIQPRTFDAKQNQFLWLADHLVDHLADHVVAFVLMRDNA